MIRPILIATIGYILGIIMGLYLNSIVLFYCIVAVIIIYILSRTKIKRYFRYVKIIINFKVIIVLLIFALIGFLYIQKKNKEYQKVYDTYGKIEAEGIVISNKKEKPYNNMYEIKIDGKKFYCYIKKSQDKDIEYGDIVFLKGKYKKPEGQRNIKGFDYAKYLKTKSIYGRIDVSHIEIKNKNKVNPIMKFANDIGCKIKENAKQIENEDIRSMYLGLVLGDTEEMDEELRQEFRDCSLAHILAVSGMHISFLVLGSLTILKKIFDDRKSSVITCFVIIIYILISGISSSVSRAGIMTIIFLLSKFFYRKNDIPTSISISLLLWLIVNPYSIMDVGLQLSYIGTIGIILFQKPIACIVKKLKVKNRRIKYKIPKFIEHIAIRSADIISVTIAAQIAILPVSLYYFNLFSGYFLITNFLVSIIIGPAFIIGIIFTIIAFINQNILSIVKWILEIVIKIILEIPKISKNLIGNKIYFPTPKLIQILIFYILSFLILYYIKIKNKKKLNASQERVINLFALFKFRISQINKSTKLILVISIFTVVLSIKIIPKDLKINFIDVGQGDSTLIVTPHNKTILVDGGGVESDTFDVGKMTLMPYLLKRGYTKVDYIMISHMDTDHVGGIFAILENLKVGEVIIPKQVELSENYSKFLKIAKEKNIKIKVVTQGDVILVEKDLQFNILWPGKSFITDNAINNNAMVMKMVYKGFSCLFTGDIEEKAEKELSKLDSIKLRATILKVAHHGSKTSTTEEFLKKVDPQIALIGVGKENTFGHPNDEVLERIEEYTNKIYRTDKNGEINIMYNFYKNVKTKIKYLYGGN